MSKVKQKVVLDGVAIFVERDLLELRPSGFPGKVYKLVDGKYLLSDTEEKIVTKAKAIEERKWRDKELDKADISLNMIQDDDKVGLVGDWRLFRKALRDYPKAEGFPHGTRPSSPDE